MRLHKSARSCPNSRRVMVDRVLSGQPVARVARDMGVSEKTVRKWVGRFLAEGEPGLQDRSSRPRNSPARTAVCVEQRVVGLRRERLTGVQIARRLRMPRSTVGAVLRRRGLGRLRFLDPPEPERRYEHPAPGDLLHLDVKKLARFDKVGHRITGRHAGLARSRGAGWDFLHVAIDDHSRVVYVEVLPDEKGETAVGFIQRALAWFEARGVSVSRILTDNGSWYLYRGVRAELETAGIRHIRTKPYTPRTNGKAERFIQTMLREWAYVRPYPTSRRRNERLKPWLDSYNRRRPHSPIGYKPPVSRLPPTRNNVSGFHS